MESNGASIELYVSELNQFEVRPAASGPRRRLGRNRWAGTEVTRATLAEDDAVTSSPPGACLVDDCPTLPDIIGPMDGWASQVERAEAESPLGDLKRKLEHRRTSSAETWAAILAGRAEGAATPLTPSFTPASATAPPGRSAPGMASVETQRQSPPTSEQTTVEQGRPNAENQRFFDEVAHCDQATPTQNGDVQKLMTTDVQAK